MTSSEREPGFCKAHPDNKGYEYADDAVKVGEHLRDTTEHNFHVIFCPSCGYYHIKRSKPINHTRHVIASILTGFLWLPFYIWIALDRRSVKKR